MGDSQVHRLGMWTAFSWISAWYGWFSGTQTWNVDCLQLCQGLASWFSITQTWNVDCRQLGQGLACLALSYTDLECGLPSAGSGPGMVGS
jgi:hypothetical protein